MADPGTGALINQLMNPPNPADHYAQQIAGMNALMQYRADRAAMDAYQQSVDPVTGEFDQPGFLAKLSQMPGGSWKLGTAMSQAGQGLQATSQGTQQQIQAGLDQLGAQALYLQPLAAKAANGQLTVQEVRDSLASMPQGLMTPTRIAQLNKQLDGLSDGPQVSNMVMGGLFANQNAREMMRARAPQPDMLNMGGYGQPIQRNAYVPGGQVFPQVPTPYTMSPEGATRANIDLNTPVPGGYDLPDGTHTYGTLGQAMKDYNVPFDKLYVNPQTGAVSGPNMPTLQMGSGAVRPPASAPAPAPAPAPSTAPPAGGAGGGGTRGGGSGAAGGATTAPTKPPVATGPPTPLISSPAPAAVPQAPGAPPSPAGGGRAGMSPQEIQQGRDAYTAAQAEQPAIQGRIATVDQALQALQGAKVGGGTQTVNEVMNVLGSYSPEWLSKVIPGYDPAKAAASAQLAAKYMQQITNAGGGLPGGASTSDKLNAAAAATPNSHMQDQASEEVLRVIKAQNQIQQYVMDQFAKTGKPAAQYQKFQADWARTHDPRAFFPLTPDMLGYLKKSVTGNERTTFNNTVHELVTNGVIPDPRKQPGTAE